MKLGTRLALATLAGLLLAASRPASAQEATPPSIFDTTGTTWVYASYFRIPWPKVDSLVKLNRFLPAWREQGVQMGCFLDSGLLIHQTGNEYNVVLSTTYAAYRKFGPGSGAGACSDRAWRAAVPDSALRAAIDDGNAWVFGDAAHYDVIYWVPYPARR